MRQIRNNFTLDLMLRRVNPLTEKYFDLTRTEDELLAKELRPNKEEQERLN